MLLLHFVLIEFESHGNETLLSESRHYVLLEKCHNILLALYEVSQDWSFDTFRMAMLQELHNDLKSLHETLNQTFECLLNPQFVSKTTKRENENEDQNCMYQLKNLTKLLIDLRKKRDNLTRTFYKTRMKHLYLPFVEANKNNNGIDDLEIVDSIFNSIDWHSLMSMNSFLYFLNAFINDWERYICLYQKELICNNDNLQKLTQLPNINSENMKYKKNNNCCCCACSFNCAKQYWIFNYPVLKILNPSPWNSLVSFWTDLKLCVQYDDAQFLHCLAISLAITLGSLLFIVPSFHKHYGFGYWAALTVAFVSDSHIGGTFLTSQLRLEGTVLGVACGFIILRFAVLFEEMGDNKTNIKIDTFNTYELISNIFVIVGLSLVIFIGGYYRCSSKRGYSGLVAQFTSALIVFGFASHTDKDTTVEKYWISRIEQTLIGLVIILFIFQMVSPNSAKILLNNEIKFALQTLKNMFDKSCMTHAFVLKSTEIERDMLMSKKDDININKNENELETDMDIALLPMNAKENPSRIDLLSKVKANPKSMMNVLSMSKADLFNRFTDDKMAVRKCLDKQKQLINAAIFEPVFATKNIDDNNKEFNETFYNSIQNLQFWLLRRVSQIDNVMRTLLRENMNAVTSDSVSNKKTDNINVNVNVDLNTEASPSTEKDSLGKGKEKELEHAASNDNIHSDDEVSGAKKNQDIAVVGGKIRKFSRNDNDDDDDSDDDKSSSKTKKRNRSITRINFDMDSIQDTTPFESHLIYFNRCYKIIVQIFEHLEDVTCLNENLDTKKFNYLGSVVCQYRKDCQKLLYQYVRENYQAAAIKEQECMIEKKKLKQKNYLSINKNDDDQGQRIEESDGSSSCDSDSHSDSDSFETKQEIVSNLGAMTFNALVFSTINLLNGLFHFGELHLSRV